MRARRLLGVLLVTAVIAGACDVDLFGFDRRTIAGPYGLHVFEGGRYYVVRERLEDGCGITNGDVRRIGWNDRVILVEQETCKVLNAPPELMLIDMTTQAVSGPFSERDLATMPELRSIHLVNADEVWDKLPIFGS